MMRMRWPLIGLLFILSGAISLGCGGPVATSTPTPDITEAAVGVVEIAEAVSEALLALESEEVDLEDALATLIEALEDLDPELLDLGVLGLDLELFDLSFLPEGDTEVNLDLGQFDLGNPTGR